MDSKFVQHYALPTSAISPIELRLFDGTSNSIITQSLELPVLFPTGESITFNFYVNPLDPLCSMVLGYNWLTHYNPLIDWVLGSIAFWPQVIDPSILTLTSSARAATLPLQTPKPSVPRISLIGAATFARASKLLGSQSFRLHLSDPSVSNEVPDLTQIPKEYYDYADVFSKTKAFVLAPHRPYDLKIKLEEGSAPLVIGLRNAYAWILQF